MSDSVVRTSTKATRLLWWIARITSIPVILLLVLMVTGEEAAKPAGAEWIYLALFPFGFSLGYLAGWRWPLWGGIISLACMAISQIVTGRVFDSTAYLIWAVFCVPGVLFILAGLKMCRTADREEMPA